jgi:DNA-directed RNA polymerase specialized sigma24 family protein
MDPGERARLSDLLARAADGDRAALDPLLAALWPRLRAFCARLVTPADADDATQEALVKLCARLATYDRSRDAVTWALTLAAWECRTVRSRARRRAGAVAVDGLTGGERPDELVARRELLEAARDVVGALSPGDAATLVAAWSEDRDGLGALAPATFRKRLERALGRFRASWRSRHDVP